MIAKKVAGTVILNKQNGQKKFLVRHTEEEYGLIEAPIAIEGTNMATILNELKQLAGLDITNIDLVELTSIRSGQDRTPLYVFEMTESADGDFGDEEKGEYTWEKASKLSEILSKFNVSVVPVFDE